MPGAPSPLTSTADRVVAIPTRCSGLNRTFETGLPDRPSGHGCGMSAAAREGFAGSGAIGRYWQTRCYGFEVRSIRGRRLGRVEAVEFDRETRAAVSLLVRRRRRKALRLRPECVEAIDPWRQSLVIALPRQKPV